MSWGYERKPPAARAVRTTILPGVYLYTPFDDTFRNWLKMTVPSGQRAWEAEEKRWWVSEEYADDAVKMAQACFPQLDTSDYFLKSQSHKQTGFGGSAQSQPPKQEPAGPQAVLFCLPSAPAEVLTAAYKALAKVYHPDAGTRPDALRMTAINGAIERLRKEGKA